MITTFLIIKNEEIPNAWQSYHIENKYGLYFLEDGYGFQEISRRDELYENIKEKMILTYE